MDDRNQGNQLVSFGPFEWDARSAELRKQGRRLRLVGQPLEVLLILLDNPDRVVSRDELRKQLWGEKAVVDFEQGLNTAIAKLRQVLGDSAEHPRYIETVPGKGYRFTAEIKRPLDPRQRPERPANTSRRTGLAALCGIASGIIIGAAVAYFGAPASRYAETPGNQLSSRFVASAPPAPPLGLSTILTDVAISPDGNTIAYRTNTSGGARLYTRRLDTIHGTLLPHLEVMSPFFSPDGTELGFYIFPERALFRTAIAGGPLIRITDSTDFIAGASWREDGTIIFATGRASHGLFRVSANGGEAKELTMPEPGTNHVLPYSLPDGNSVLFAITSGDGSNEGAATIAILDLIDGSYRKLTQGTHPYYTTSGHLVYVLNDNLMAVGFDADNMAIEGTPVVVESGIATSPETTVHAGQYALSNNGSLLVVKAGQEEERQLVWVDRAGSETILDAEPRGYTYPRVAPDGSHVAVNVRDSNGAGIELWNLEHADAIPETLGQGLTFYPVWTSDSSKLLYESSYSKAINLYLKSIDSSDAGEQINPSPLEQLRAPYFFTPANDELVFAQQSDSGAELWMMKLGEEADPILLQRNARNADISPNGQYFVYQSDTGGQFEIFVRSFPDADGRVSKISVNGGIQPVWSPTGSEIFYVEPGPQPRMMSVKVEFDNTLILSRPQALFDWPYYTAELGRTYDVSRPDANRFLAVKSIENSDNALSAPSVEIVLNWFQELEAAVAHR